MDLSQITGQMSAVALSQGENLRVQKLKNALSTIQEQQDRGSLRPEEAEALRVQVSSGLQPLIQRQSEEAELARQAEQTQVQMQNVELTKAENFRRTSGAQNAPNQIVDMPNPRTGQTDYFYFGPDGNLTPMFNQAEEQQGSPGGTPQYFPLAAGLVPGDNPPSGASTTTTNTGSSTTTTNAGSSTATQEQGYVDLDTVARIVNEVSSDAAIPANQRQAEVERRIDLIRRYAPPPRERQPTPSRPLTEQEQRVALLRERMLELQLAQQAANLERMLGAQGGGIDPDRAAIPGVGVHAPRPETTRQNFGGHQVISDGFGNLRVVYPGDQEFQPQNPTPETNVTSMVGSVANPIAGIGNVGALNRNAPPTPQEPAPQPPGQRDEFTSPLPVGRRPGERVTFNPITTGVSSQLPSGTAESAEAYTDVLDRNGLLINTSDESNRFDNNEGGWNRSTALSYRQQQLAYIQNGRPQTAAVFGIIGRIMQMHGNDIQRVMQSPEAPTYLSAMEEMRRLGSLPDRPYSQGTEAQYLIQVNRGEQNPGLNAQNSGEGPRNYAGGSGNVVESIVSRPSYGQWNDSARRALQESARTYQDDPLMFHAITRSAELISRWGTVSNMPAGAAREYDGLSQIIEERRVAAVQSQIGQAGRDQPSNPHGPRATWDDEWSSDYIPPFGGF